MTAGVNNDGLSVPVPNVASGVPPLSALASSHTLQGYIENVFMNTANNLLYNKMLPLQSALVLTQTALDWLASVQTAHNSVAAQSVPGFLSSSPTFTTYQGATTAGYSGPASAYFNSPVLIKPTFSTQVLSAGKVAAALEAVLTMPTNTTYNSFGSKSAIITGLQAGIIDIARTLLITGGTVSTFTPSAAGLLIAPIANPANPPPYLEEGILGGTAQVPGFPLTYQSTIQIAISGNVITYASAYQVIASAQAFRMGQLEASSYSPAYFSALNNLIQLRNQLSGQILPSLLASDPNTAADQNSLYSKLRIVLSGLTRINMQSSMPVFHVVRRSAVGTGPASGIHYYVYSGYYSYPSTTPGSFAAWLIDGYNTTAGAGANSAGTVNQSIINAITSGESANTNQTSSVSNFLLMYQQYYQTAAALLKQMTQVIEQIAQGIK